MSEISQYPFDSRVPRRVILVGKLRHLKDSADKKRGFKTDVVGNPRASTNFKHYGEVMAERWRRESEGK